MAQSTRSWQHLEDEDGFTEWGQLQDDVEPQLRRTSPLQTEDFLLWAVLAAMTLVPAFGYTVAQWLGQL
ncbi:MAG TPA: hypothetical protein VEA35_01865 [Ramlibacter sp.]|nr:hypothetical protein [Ramlibacter sp.]